MEGQGIPWSCSSQNPVLPGNSAVPPGNSVPWEFCPHSHSPQSPPNPIPSFQARNEAWNPLFLAPKIPNPPGNGRREGFHGIPAKPGPGSLWSHPSCNFHSKPGILACPEPWECFSLLQGLIVCAFPAFPWVFGEKKELFVHQNWEFWGVHG